MTGEPIPPPAKAPEPLILLRRVVDGWAWSIREEHRTIEGSSYSLEDALTDVGELARAHGLA